MTLEWPSGRALKLISSAIIMLCVVLRVVLYNTFLMVYPIVTTTCFYTMEKEHGMHVARQL